MLFQRNRFGKKRKINLGTIGFIAGVVTSVIILYLFAQGFGNLADGNETQSLEAVRTAVSRAAVQFYAIEGRFPPHLRYLEERFGLQLDHEKYVIQYTAIGSNLMPQIFVQRRE